MEERITALVFFFLGSCLLSGRRHGGINDCFQFKVPVSGIINKLCVNLVPMLDTRGNSYLSLKCTYKARAYCLLVYTAVAAGR